MLDNKIGNNKRNFLRRIPVTGQYNVDDELREQILFHHQVMVPVTDGKLDLGPWQQVFYAEFDGQRRKRMLLKVFGE
jgi:thiamine phosphate synthase YjbQ (UPF0047 family)